MLMRALPSRGRLLQDRAASVAVLLGAAVAAALAAPGAAQRQFDELVRGLPRDALTTTALVSGDVDGDGNRDVIVGISMQQARLYLNNGAGEFTDATATRLPTGMVAADSMALGDVDGDGDLDLVATTNYNSTRRDRLYLNSGAGVFTDATVSRLPFHPDLTASLAFGDVDRDGDLDLILGTWRDLNQNRSSGQVRLYVNNGAGTFTDTTSSRMPTTRDTAAALALGDVDRDGDLDLVVGNNTHFWGGGQSQLLLNDGAGSFALATFTNMPFLSFNTTAVALGDVDGDGDLDLVLGNTRQQQSRLYLNDGTGVFTDGTHGRLPTRNDNTNTVAMADQDGDGDLDLIFGNGYAAPQTRLYLNNGAGTFTDATSNRMPADSEETRASTLLDADQDGDLDLFLGNDAEFGGSHIRLYLNNGAATFTDATATPLPGRIQQTQAIAVGDVDGDGDLDLVLGNGSFYYGTQSRLYLNDGRGMFVDATAARMPLRNEHAGALALGDVDGDGDLDLVVGNRDLGLQGGGQARLYLNNGSGTFTVAPATQMPQRTDQTAALALGDVDRDGDLDLVLGIGDWRQPQINRLYLNDGRGRFKDETSTRMPAISDLTEALALGDVDGDGDLDLVVGNASQYGSQNRLYLNNGAGSFTNVTATRMPAFLGRTMAVELGDVDRDGDLDLVVGNTGRYGGPTQLFLNNGAGTFVNATATRMPMAAQTTQALALGDVDRDGDLDLVVGNYTDSFWSSRTLLYLNNGTGTFTDAAARLPSNYDQTVAVALGDMDRDGDPDLVIANYRQQHRLLVNLLHHIHAPTVLHVGRIYRLDAYARYGQATAALPYFSLATATIPIPPVGTIGIDPAQAIQLPPFPISSGSGVGTLSLPIPLVPALAGIPIYTQAILQNGTHLRLTNVVGDVVLR